MGIGGKDVGRGYGGIGVGRQVSFRGRKGEERGGGCG